MSPNSSWPPETGADEERAKRMDAFFMATSDRLFPGATLTAFFEAGLACSLLAMQLV